MYNVLFLASWYPSKVDPFDGDFIERHAKSISLTNRVFVIYVVKDPSDKKRGSNSKQRNFREFNFVQRLLSLFKIKNKMDRKNSFEFLDV